MDELNFEKMSVEELAKLISPSAGAYVELKNRGILRTKNVVGELGEYYTINYYNKKTSLPNLFSAPVGVKNVDALSRDGETYSIKTVTSRNGTTGSFWEPESIEENNKYFHYLIVAILDNSYKLDILIELTWEEFFKYKSYNKRMNNYNISLSKKIIESSKIIYDSENKLI